MKKQILLAAFSCATLISTAQTVVLDTVNLGAGYANQVWYSLPNDEQGTQAKNNWDLAFRTSGSMGSSILSNNTGSASIWLYPKSGISGWSSVDTTGLTTWPKLYNMETEWTGALGRYVDPSNPYDLGWGIYDLGTHYVTGDSIYIVKTQAGNYKKLIIDRLASGTYTFTYANLNGTDSTTSSIAKTAYGTKNFGYFSLDTKTAINREPDTDNWDLVFGQYATGDYASMGLAGYTVTGILVNDTLKVALSKVDPATRATDISYAALTFSDNINKIGYNWKTYDGVSMTYKLNDSSIYFIRRNNGDIWKVILTGFSSTTGSFLFSKQRLTAVSIKENEKTIGSVAVAPNPSVNGQTISVAYYFEASVETASLNIYDMSGRVVLTRELEKTAGMHAYSFDGNALTPGTYIINVIADHQQTQQKLVVQ